MTSMQNDEPIPKGLSKQFWRIPNNRYLYKQCKDIKIVLHDIHEKRIPRKEPMTVIIDVDDDDDDKQEEVKKIIISDDEDEVQSLRLPSLERKKVNEYDVQYRMPISGDREHLAPTNINMENIKKRNHINIELNYPDFKDCYSIDTSGQLQTYDRHFDVIFSEKVLDMGQIDVCCWYRREGFLKDLLIDGVINDQSFKFMRTRHQCRLDICVCCQECKQKASKVVDATNAITTKNNVKLEHMISMMYNKRPRIPRTMTHSVILNKVRQKYCNNEMFIIDKRAILPQRVKRKSFKNTILIISKILPNDAKDIEIYIIGPNMTDVSCHLFLNHKDEQSPLSSLSKTHNLTRSKLYEYNICCWFEREELINRLTQTSGAPIEELNFLKKKHFCLFKPSCDCCCKEKQKENEPIVDNGDIPNVDNNSITEEALLEDEIKIEIEEEVLLPQDPLQIENIIKKETEAIAPSNIYSPESRSVTTNTTFETGKKNNKKLIDKLPNQIPIKPPNHLIKPTIQPSNIYSPESRSATTNTAFETGKGNNKKLIDKLPNQIPIKPPNHLINPTIQIKSSFLKKLLDSEAPLKYPSKKTEPRIVKKKPVKPIPREKNTVPRLIKNPALKDKSLETTDAPVPVFPPVYTETPTETIVLQKRNVTSITLEVIEIRLKTFRSELLKLASLTDSHVKKVINDGFQNMLDNLNPNKNAEAVNDEPDPIKNKPEIVENVIEFAKDSQQTLELEVETEAVNDEPDPIKNKPEMVEKVIEFAKDSQQTLEVEVVTRDEPSSHTPEPAKKVILHRKNKTIPLKTSKIRKRKRTAFIDELDYNIYCDKLNNFYKKLHL